MVLKRDFILQPDIETIQTAFSQARWPLVLDKLLVPEKCAEAWMDQLSTGSRMDKPKFWPSNEDQDKGKRPTYAEVINQIRDVIANLKRPLAINFCAVLKPEFKSTAQCASAGFAHAVVIEGYRQMCNRSGACVDSLKVRNSWGMGGKRPIMMAGLMQRRF